jgi:hypothetical protein
VAVDVVHQSELHVIVYVIRLQFHQFNSYQLLHTVAIQFHHVDVHVFRVCVPVVQFVGVQDFVFDIQDVQLFSVWKFVEQ